MFEAILLISTVTFFGVLSPGPDMILVIQGSSSGNIRHGLATALGICLGNVLHISFALFGLAAVVTQSIVLYSLIKYLGAAYLIYLGIKALRSNSSSSLDLEAASATKPEGTELQAFYRGFLCNLLNPKCAIFMLSLFSSVIPADSLVSEKIILGGVVVLQSLLMWSVLAFVLHTEPAQQILGRIEQKLQKFFGAVLLAFGLAVAVRD